MPVTLKGRQRQRNSSDDPEEFRATLVEHLEELRDRIIRCVWIIAIAWVAGWYLEPWLYGALEHAVEPAVVKRLHGIDFKNVFHTATDPFMLKIKLSFFIAIGISFPFIVNQLWGFVAPGLKPHERKPLKQLAPFSVLLFAMGAGFCWFILPSAFSWFASYVEEFPGTALYQEAGALAFLSIKLLIAFGIGFQLPLVVFILGKLGLLSPDTLMRNWRQAAVAIFAVSAIITPSNDPLTMLMMAVPLCIMFMISVWAVRFTSRKSMKGEESLNDLD